MKCLPKRISALPVPRSSNSENPLSNFHEKSCNRLTLKEQWQEGYKEYQENGDDATVYPVEYRNQIVATRLTQDDIALRVHVAYGKLFVECANIQYCNEE